jgi:hypothetical protein
MKLRLSFARFFSAGDFKPGSWQLPLQEEGRRPYSFAEFLAIHWR